MAGPTIDELLIADEPERWAELGFGVAGGSCQVGAVRLTFAGSEAGRGILGWSVRELTGTELDGLPTTRSQSSFPSAAPTHANGVSTIDHVVAISPAFERSVQALTDAGLDLRRVREEPTATGAPRQAFFRLGREILELVAEPEDVVARAGGSDRPAYFWGLALLAEDLERTVEMLGEHAGTIRPAVQGGRRIVTVRRSAGLSVPLALISPAPPS